MKRKESRLSSFLLPSETTEGSKTKDSSAIAVLDYWRSRKAWFSFAWAALCPHKIRLRMTKD